MFLAIKILGNIGDPKAITQLIESFHGPDFYFFENDRLQSSYGPLKKAIVDALTKIGESAVDPLIIALGSESRDIRILTAEALGNIGDPRAVMPLIKARELEALVKIGKPAVNPLIETLKSESYIDRSLAARALGNIGEHSAAEELIKYLNDKDYEVRRYVIEALGKIGDARVIDPLIGILNNSEERSSSVQEAAAYALGKIGDARAVDPLIGILNNSEEGSGVQEAAAYALGSIGDYKAIEPLSSILYTNRGSDSYRRASVYALGRIGGRGLDILEEIMLSKNNFATSLRAYIAEVLGDVDVSTSPNVLFSLIKCLGDSDIGDIVESVLSTKIGEPSIKPCLEIILQDIESPAVVAGAVSVVDKLARKGNDSAIRALLSLVPKIENWFKTSKEKKLVRSSNSALNSMLNMENSNRDIKEKIWEFYFSFIENPSTFTFFAGSYTPPIFKSETVNNVGFMLVVALKSSEFEENREEYLRKIILFSKNRLTSKNKTDYRISRLLASVLNSSSSDIVLSADIREGIEQLKQVYKGPDDSIFKEVMVVKCYFQDSLSEKIWVSEKKARLIQSA